MSRLTVTSGYLDILGPLVVMSLGMGMQFVSLTLTAVRGVAPSETGLASALLNTGQQLGGALGLSVLATVAIDATTTKARSLTAAAHGHATGLTHLIAIGHGYTTAFEVAAGIASGGPGDLGHRDPRPPATCFLRAGAGRRHRRRGGLAVRPIVPMTGCPPTLRTPNWRCGPGVRPEPGQPLTAAKPALAR